MTAPSPQHVTEQNRFELLLDAVSDHAIYMLDDRGFVTSWNTGAQKINGYRSIEVIGQHWSRFFTPEDRASRLPERILEMALATGRHEAEGWRMRKDGSRFWCNAVLQPARDEDGKLIGFADVTRDITERVAAQQALLDSERCFRMLVEGIVDYAIYMLDPSGIITNWNTGAEHLKGYTADEIIGQHFSWFYTAEDRAKGMPARVLETGVSSGVSSAHLLLGLRANRSGRLTSIDLPTRQRGARLARGESPVSLPPGREPGWAVPATLRRGWDLRIGPAQELLPRVASEGGPIGLFLHDDLHTPAHLTFELAALRPRLVPGAVVLADNTVWTGDAFPRFARALGVPMVRRRRSDLVGARLPPAPAKG